MKERWRVVIAECFFALCSILKILPDQFHWKSKCNYRTFWSFPVSRSVWFCYISIELEVFQLLSAAVSIVIRSPYNWMRLQLFCLCLCLILNALWIFDASVMLVYLLHLPMLLLLFLSIQSPVCFLILLAALVPLPHIHQFIAQFWCFEFENLFSYDIRVTFNRN